MRSNEQRDRLRDREGNPPAADRAHALHALLAHGRFAALHESRASGDAQKTLLPKPKVPEVPFEFNGVRTVSFEKQIRPLVESKCLDCHGSEGGKSKLSLASREGFLRGGQSGVQLIKLGDGLESQIIRHVLDKVEDMEMPPLYRRSKYGKLTEKEVSDLATWISEGADWPDGLVLDE